MTTLTFDVETPTKNKGHPFTPSNFLVSYSLKEDNGTTTFHYYTEPDFFSCLRRSMASATLVIGFNLKFDFLWLRRYGIIIPPGCRVWDCSLAEFVLSGQTAVMASLDETLASYGLEPKQDKVAEYWQLGISTEDIPVPILEEYNNLDVDRTHELYLMQQSFMSDKLKNLCLLQGQDLLTLVEAEYAGLKFDTDKCLLLEQQYEEALVDLRAEMASYLPPIPHECTFNWDSGDHMSALLYGGSITFDWRTEEHATYKSGPKKGETYLKGSWHSHVQEFPRRFRPLEGTTVKKCLGPGYSGTMFYQVDDPTLKQLTTRKNEDRKLLALLDTFAKKSQVLKMFQTFLKHINELEWENDVVHGQYNQNIARTGRLSSSKPNLQNTPPELDELLISRYD